MEEKDKLILLYKEKMDENKIQIKLRIINRLKDMIKIIKNNELNLPKWNANNVTDMSYLFTSCSS